MKLPLSYYLNKNVVEIAKDLIGKKLVTNIGGVITSGIITETEAYAGVTDRASHAYGGKRTKRTEIMFAKGGVAYVYLCYGVHALFNIVIGPEGVPDAILIRGIKVKDGSEVIRQRLQATKFNNGSIHGPGKVTKALGIKVPHNGTNLLGDLIWLEENEGDLPGSKIITTTRIGIDYAGEDALLPWRFITNSL